MPPRPGRFAPLPWRVSCLALALAACAGSTAPMETDPDRDVAHSPATTAAAPTPDAAPLVTVAADAAAPTTAASIPIAPTTASTALAAPAVTTAATTDTDPPAKPATTTTSIPTTAAPTTTITITTAATAPTTTAAPTTTITTTATTTTTAAPPTTITTTATTTTTAAPTTTTTAPSETGTPRRYRPHPVATLPHDRTSFTQGLAWRQGVFYESSGLYGKSSVRIVDPATGEVIKEQLLPDRYFGEGLEVVGDRVVQLTWREETAFIWETDTLAPLGTFSYQGEGWGLCAQADRFVMSDGSDVLTFRHLETFAPLGSVRVARNGEPVTRLNELECAGGLVYANIWLTDTIAVIDPDTGAVSALIDCSDLAGLLDDREGIDVLNGIAYRPDQDRFYQTGKLWPNLFLTEMVPDP